MLLKALGMIALGILLVAVILYLSGNRTNAQMALGVGITMSGIALIMYSLRPS
jgi:hypothetical protein